jgi:hypothetical protein
MKYFLLILLFIAFAQFSNLSAQTEPNRYETEFLTNPNPGKKDTREVNAVLVFEKDALRIYSRRNKELFKEFRYSEIEFVEHSFSKNPFFESTKTAVLMTLITGLPLTYNRKEKHWLTIGGKDDFAVLKIENDNYRLIRMEFFIRDLEISNVNENNL